MSNANLSGRSVRLVPLSLDHAEALFPSASDPEVWQWMPRRRPENVAQTRAMLGRMLADQARRCFAVLRAADDKVIGSTSLYELDLAQGRASSTGPVGGLTERPRHWPVDHAMTVCPLVQSISNRVI
jgi:RimJ/RimL family protein N-acetyltransferase